VPSRPPFIGRWRDFYIPTIPSNSENIPSVNAHTNVFYISCIYKLATSSHAKPELFWDDNFDFASRWFVNALVQEVFTHRDSRTHSPPYSRISQIPEVRGFAGSWLQVFTNSQLRGPAGSRLRAVTRSRLRDFESSGVQLTVHSWLQNFVDS
jgi:hypothetical protein